MAQIQVTVVEARNLKKMDLFSQSDGFVEVYLDDKIQKEKTKVIHNSKNPHWDEAVVLNHLQGQDILHINVYDEDPLKKDIIGLFTIDLHDLYEKGHMDQWYTIPSKFRGKSHGELHLKLEYQPLKV